MVFGRSIGSGPATHLAAKRKPCALILMSPFTSIKGAVETLVGKWAKPFVKERFVNIDLMQEVKVPTFILHGEADTLIPISHAHALHAQCKGVSMLVGPEDMDHNDFDFYEHLMEPLIKFLKNAKIELLPYPQNLQRLVKEAFEKKKQIEGVVVNEGEVEIPSVFYLDFSDIDRVVPAGFEVVEEEE